MMLQDAGRKAKNGSREKHNGKEGAAMYPCHIFNMPDPAKAYEDFRGELVKDYGDCVSRRDGRVLHWNYMWDDGYRSLVRCRECGGLVLMQSSEYHSFSDAPDGYYRDWIPVATEEEADLLNVLLDAGEFERHPHRRFSRTNGDCHLFGTDGLKPCDPEELKKQILKKYGLSSLDEVKM